MPQKLLFVCLGNICRSPIAEGVFLHLCKARGLENKYQADSAGTGDWHLGQRPDPRSIEAAERQGVSLPSLARLVQKSDFANFDLILAMDRSNHSNLLELFAIPNSDHAHARLSTKVQLMRDYDTTGGHSLDVPDPYYGTTADFDRVFQILHHSCSNLLDSLEGKIAKS